MEHTLQSVYNRIQETKKKQKDIRDMYKDALAGVQEYQDIQEKMKTLRARRKQIEISIKEQFANEITKLEDMKIDLESDKELLSDLAIKQMMQGKTVEVIDGSNNQYAPEFKVTFKKIN